MMRVVAATARQIGSIRRTRVRVVVLWPININIGMTISAMLIAVFALFVRSNGSTIIYILADLRYQADLR